MAVENAPWAVQDAAHSAAVARTLAYASTAGATGVVGLGDMAVRATATPSSAVRVGSGAAIIRNRSTGAAQQSYTARNVTETLVEIPASGSAGSQTYYICAVVRDPEYPGTQRASDPLTAQYFYLECLQSVPATLSAIRLAKVVVPANTATITQAMITDLREVANPRRSEVMLARPNVGSDTDGKLGNRTKGGEQFPGGGGTGGGYSHQIIDIPEWASVMLIEAQWISLKANGKSAWGQYWIEYGNEHRGNGWEASSSTASDGYDYEFRTQSFGWDVNETGIIHRVNWLLADHRTIPNKLRGKSCNFVFKANLSTGPTARADAIEADSISGLMLRVTFVEDAFYWQDAG